MKKQMKKTRGKLQFSIFWKKNAPLKAKMMKNVKKKWWKNEKMIKKMKKTWGKLQFSIFWEAKMMKHGKKYNKMINTWLKNEKI